MKDTKKCPECGIEKNKNEFYMYSYTISAYCKTCTSSRIRKNRKHINEIRNKQRKTKVGRETRLREYAKQRAKEQELPFNITRKEIEIPDYCSCCGIVLESGNGIMQDNSPTLDKIVPKLGYVNGNIKVICAKCNRQKSDLTLSELKRLVEYVEKFTS